MSSLRISAFSEGGAPDAFGLSDRDAELELLQSEIEDAQSEIQTLALRTDHAREEHKVTLSGLVTEIDAAREHADAVLTRERASHETTLENLRAKLALEEKSLRLQVANCRTRDLLFEKAHRDVRVVQETAVIDDMQRKAERDRAKIEEEMMMTTMSEVQKNHRQRDSRNSALLTIRGLEREIAELQSLRRETRTAFQLKIGDMMGQMEMKEREAKSFTANLYRAMDERDVHFADHIAAVREQLKHEKMANDGDIKVTSEQCENLQKLHQAVVRRGSQQLAQLSRDIERMGRVVETATREEERDETTNAKSVTKMYSLNAETDAMARRTTGVQEELEVTRRRNHTGLSMLRHSETRAKSGAIGRRNRNAIFS